MRMLFIILDEVLKYIFNWPFFFSKVTILYDIVTIMMRYIYLWLSITYTIQDIYGRNKNKIVPQE